MQRSYVVDHKTGKLLRMIGAIMDITERLAVLRDRNRVQAQLVSQNLRSQVLANITLKIRQSLQIEQILQTPNSQLLISNQLHCISSIAIL
ncbi:MAG: hypothetical protein V7K21_06515 [Nostoc sp.]